MVLALAIAALLLGNGAILAAHAWAARGDHAVPLVPVDNFAIVDARVWRGAAPEPRAYRALRSAGVTTIVDLRAERDLHVDDNALTALGVRRVHLPIRDGQAPSSEQVQRFLDVVTGADGRVFVHCGAGVGRTGTMTAAYLVATGQASAATAVRRNLEVGPPSLEQIAFAANLDGGPTSRPPGPLVAVSRVLDAPRRLWVTLRSVT